MLRFAAFRDPARLLLFGALVLLSGCPAPPADGDGQPDGGDGDGTGDGNGTGVVRLDVENMTGFDLVVGFNAADAFDALLARDGQTVSRQLDCVERIELLFEYDFDPQTGELVNDYDLSDGVFERPADFECDQVLIITFTADEITSRVEPLGE